MNIDPISIGGWVGGVAAGTWAGINHFRIGRQQERKESAAAIDGAHRELLETLKERIKTVEQDRDDWKKRCQDEHREYADYRKETHERINEANARLLRQAELIAELQAKTDLTPILKFHEEQNEINKEILTGLRSVVESLNHLRPPAAQS